MEQGTFIFNGDNSKDKYGVMVQYKPTRTASARNVIVGSPTNRNGSIIRDMGTYPNASLELSCWFKIGQSNIDDITDWLNTPDYVDFIPWYDPNFVYRVKVVEEPQMGYVSADNRYVVFTLKFTMLPFKYQASTYKTAQTLTSGSIITNPFKYTAFPIFNITSAGAGDVVLTVGGVSYTYKKFSSTLVVDSYIPKVSSPELAVGLDFPTLKPGGNTITWINATNVTMIPRYGRRAL